MAGGGLAVAALIIPNVWDSMAPAGDRPIRRNLLKIPPLLIGKRVAGSRQFDLTLQSGLSRFFEDRETPTIGINGAYLGPTLQMVAGEAVRINVTNRLTEPATLHWHGFHLPASADGGPHQPIEPGEIWSPSFEVKQRASLFWYHSHTHRQTGPQVYHGLAGSIYVRDEASERLDLPNDYGIDDIPLIIQDRAFNTDGSFAYSTSMMNLMMGVTGDTLLVNGTIAPVFEAKNERLRLRLLNASNARFYRFGFDDGRRFHQIASDGGLLPRPHPTSSIELAPAERAEIIVDVSDSRPVRLRASSAGQGMMGGVGMMGSGMMGGGMMGDKRQFEVLEIRPNSRQRRSARLPVHLVDLESPDPTSAIRTRRFVLNMSMGGMTARGGAFTINGKSMDMTRIDEVVRIGTSEIWEISNVSMMAHPFHVHDGQFRILDRNGLPPSIGEQGLKDVVVVAPRERVRILMRFDDYADPDLPYMYHCHILEHEDAGMMGQFVVTH